jgi:Phage integrase family/Phage integrase, N-terminal SAM-like domain
MVTIDNWQERMSEDMRLRDYRPRTQEGYLGAMRHFVEWLGRGPETATDKDVRDYFLYLREEKQLAPFEHPRHPLRPALLLHPHAAAPVQGVRGAPGQQAPHVARRAQPRGGPRTTTHLFVTAAGKAPMHETTLQKTFTAARADAGLNKEATIHTLRHSYATHLLEAGISLRTIQHVLGHKSMRTTELYMHVTQPGTEKLQETLDRMMVNL